MKIPTQDFNKETEEAVYFFTPRFYALDNFAAFIIEIWGKKFQTSEHAYQWKKYAVSYPELAQEIFDATNPHRVKNIADAHKEQVSPEFHEQKAGIMLEILKAKTEQHEKVQRLLKETGMREIVENSPLDSFWGVGPDGNGENMLGKLWMKVRDDLPH